MNINNKLFLYIFILLTYMSTIVNSISPNFSDLETAKNFIEKKLKENNLSIPISPFKYCYQNEVLFGEKNESFELDKEIEKFASSYNIHLNHSIFFDADFISNPEKVRRYHLKKKPFKQNIGQIITVETQDNQKIDCTFFGRNSDTLLVVGEGFTNNREVMSPFVDMFQNYDIVLFDYRGHGYKNTETETSLTKMLFGVNCNQTGLGKQEEKDVFAVVDSLRKIKNYKNVYGLGVCYSALIFSKAQGIREQSYKHKKLFDKLILDGCWLSLENFIEKLLQDLKRICSPQYGGWKNQWPLNTSTCQKIIKTLAQDLFKTRFNEISILDYIPHIKNAPILIFYGKDDLVINRHEFETIWHAIKAEKTAIVTSNPHVRNHLKQKELYKLISELFLELPHGKFVSCLKNKDELIEHFSEKLVRSIN